MKNPIFPAALALALTAGTASAEWVQPAKVRLQNDNSFTPWADANVAFETGGEMNRATDSFNYNALTGRYAVITSAGGQRVIVSLAGYAFCMGPFTRGCLPGGWADGYDDQGRHWQICTAPACT